MLRNRVYLGELNNKAVSYAGEHPAIIDAELFAAVQVKLTANLNRRDLRKGKSGALLTGCIFDDRGKLHSSTASCRRASIC